MGNNEKIPEILRSAHVYIMPSLWEGLSVSLLEAISIGIPIIATDVGSNKKVLLESKDLLYKVISPNSVTAIEEAVIELITEHKKHLIETDDRLNKLPSHYRQLEFIKKHEELYLSFIK